MVVIGISICRGKRDLDSEYKIYELTREIKALKEPNYLPAVRTKGEVIRIMAKTHEDYLKSPEFQKAKLMVQQGKHGERAKAASIALSMMNLDKDEKNPNLYPHINDRKLAEMLGMPNPDGGGKTAIWRARRDLKRERWGVDGKVYTTVEKIDTSKMKVIGSGSESVYLYYFPTYELYARSTESTDFPCNIGQTKGNVTERVSQQIGQQLPEKAVLALDIKTDDCVALEGKIHEKLKGEKLEGAVGEEWFLTNPTEVEGIVKSIDEKRERAKQLLTEAGIKDPSKALTQFDTIKDPSKALTLLDTLLKMRHSTKNSNE